MTLKQKLKNLILVSNLLSQSKKGELIDRLSNLTDEQCEKLFSTLGKEPDFLKMALQKSLKQKLETEGEKGIYEFEQILRQAKKNIVEAEEKVSVKRESEKIDDIEGQFDNL